MEKEISYRVREVGSRWIWEVLIDGVIAASGIERGAVTARAKALGAAFDLCDGDRRK